MLIGYFGRAPAGNKVARKPASGAPALAAQPADGKASRLLLPGYDGFGVVPGTTAGGRLLSRYPYTHRRACWIDRHGALREPGSVHGAP